MPDRKREQKERNDKEKKRIPPEKNLYLIGFMGSGKTAVSRTFQQMYGFEILEMDERIEEERGMPIPDFFRVHGEEAFRKEETQLLRQIAQKKHLIISCGGGTPMREENVALMKKSGIIVWLRAKPETVLERVSRSHNRPLLEGRKNIVFISELMDKRREQYEAAADIIVAVDQKSRKRICREILEKIEEEECTRMYREQTDAFIDAHKEEMLEDLKRLIRINSEKGEALPGKPFGEGPAAVLAEASRMISDYGFAVTNYDNYCITADFNDREKQLDILAHLDVVPVSPQDWTVTQPFEPVILDGRIYGRGTSDDKGPAVAALYAMRAVKECGIDLKKNVRLILGSDEECGSSDLVYYYGKEQEAPMTFTPDASFPVINTEKGRLAKAFSKEFSDAPVAGDIVEFHSGTAVNIVPAKAMAVIKGLSAEAVQKAADEDQSGIRFTVTSEGDTVKIEAKGLAAHASLPENGNNALCGLLELLSALDLADTKRTEAFRRVSGWFPREDYAGAGLGIAMQDEISGALTMNLGKLDYDGKKLTGVFDSRVPVCGTDENVTRVVEKQFAQAGFTFVEGDMSPVHHVPAESELVQTLLASYECYTGIKGEAVAIGGGTYVHNLERGVAFGCEIEGVDNHMHGDDEFMEIDVMVMSAKIFADAILRLCGE